MEETDKAKLELFSMLPVIEKAKTGDVQALQTVILYNILSSLEDIKCSINQLTFMVETEEDDEYELRKVGEGEIKSTN